MNEIIAGTEARRQTIMIEGFDDEPGIAEALGEFLDSLPGKPIKKIATGFEKSHIHPEWGGQNPVYLLEQAEEGWSLRLKAVQEMKASEVSMIAMVAREAAAIAFATRNEPNDANPLMDMIAESVEPMLLKENTKHHEKLDNRVDRIWAETIQTILSCGDAKNPKQFHENARLKLISRFGISSDEANEAMEAFGRQVNDKSANGLYKTADDFETGYEKLYAESQAVVLKRLTAGVDPAWAAAIDGVITKRG